MTSATGAASQQFVAAANRLPTLFELEAEADRLLTLLETTTDPDEAAETEALLTLSDQLLIEKAESYIAVIRTLDSMAAVRKAEADRLHDRAKRAVNQADWLRQRLLAHLKRTGRSRIETSKFSVSVRLNPPSVNVLNAAAIPGEYQRTKVTVEPNKVAILANFEATGEIPNGVEIVRKESLRIA